MFWNFSSDDINIIAYTPPNWEPYTKGKFFQKSAFVTFFPSITFKGKKKKKKKWRGSKEKEKNKKVTTVPIWDCVWPENIPC